MSFLFALGGKPKPPAEKAEKPEGKKAASALFQLGVLASIQ